MTIVGEHSRKILCTTIDDEHMLFLSHDNNKCYMQNSRYYSEYWISETDNMTIIDDQRTWISETIHKKIIDDQHIFMAETVLLHFTIKFYEISEGSRMTIICDKEMERKNEFMFHKYNLNDVFWFYWDCEKKIQLRMRQKLILLIWVQ